MSMRKAGANLVTGRLLIHASSHLQVAAGQCIHRANQRNGVDCRDPGDRPLLQLVHIGRIDGDR